LAQDTIYEHAFIAKGTTYGGNHGSWISYLVNKTGQLGFRWRPLNGGDFQSFTNIYTFQTGHLYHIGLVIDGRGKKFRFRIYDATEDIVNTYNFSTSQEIYVDGYPLLLNHHGYPVGGGSINCYVDELCVFNRLLSDTEIDLIRNNEFIPLPILDDCRSLTTCQALGKIPNLLRSLTSCEAISLLAPDILRSLTKSEVLTKAIANALISKTRCQSIILDGGDFFLAF
jgi:hypothetical protein